MAGLPEAGDTYGRYRLLSELGGGESSRVFVATAHGSEVPVAVKVVRPDPDDLDGLHDRVTRVAAKLAHVRSHSIASVLDVGRVNDTVFLCSEYVEGGDLGTWIRSNGPLPRPEALRLVAGICQALDDADRSGLFHGNLKPSNVLLFTDDEGVQPKVGDFSVASVAGGSVPSAGTPAEALAYVAPETLLGRKRDLRSDVYSVGCLLWVALEGKSPYGGTSFQVMQGHVRGPIPHIHAKDPVNHAINDLLRFSLAKDPVNRIQRLPELRDALLALAGGELPHAPTKPAEIELPLVPVPDVPEPAAAAAPVTEPTRSRGTDRGNLKVAAGFAAGLLLGGTVTALLSGSDEAAPVAVSSLVRPTVTVTATPTPAPSHSPKPKPRPKPKPSQSPGAATEKATAVTGDYTGDGLGDLLLSRGDGAASTVLLTAAKGSFRSRDLLTLGSPDSRTLRGDFNGDGSQDLLELAPAGTNVQIRLWASDGAAPLTPSAWRTTNLSWSGLTVAAGDVDGDGADDLVSESATDLQVLPVAGQGALVAVPWGPRNVPGLVEGIVAGDFNGDGLADVVEYADNGAGVTLFFHRSEGTRFEAGKAWGKHGDWRLQELDVLVGDFDGDGTADLAAVPKPVGGSFEILVLRSTGAGLQAPSAWTSSNSVDWAATRIVAGDFDGDGRTDVASLEQKPQGLTVGVRRSLGSEFDSVAEWAELLDVPWSRDAAAGLGR